MNKIREFKINWFNKRSYLCVPLALSMMIGANSYAGALVSENTSITVINQINQKKVKLNINKKPLRFILNEIKSQSGIGFVLNDNILDGNLNQLSIKVDDVTVAEALEILFKETAYEARIVDNVITVVKRVAKIVVTNQAKAKVSFEGRVVDAEDRKSVSGATVILKGTSSGAITDMNGAFTLMAEEGQIIEVSYVGMIGQEIKLEKSKSLSIVLKRDAMTLDDVVVTGFNDIKKSSYTGNATTVKRDELLKVSKTNVMKALQTFDPSFRIKENNRWGSDPNALPEVYIRGESGMGVKELDRNELSKSSLKDNPNLPTFIMDGFEISATTLYDMDPNRIESITILKDAAATAMYGSRAANGVIVITTVVPKPGKLNVSYNFVGDFVSPDLSDYDLLNAAEKLEVERLAGNYNVYDEWTDEYTLQREYNKKLANVKEGVDTYWLSKPLRTVFNHKHSLAVDGGNENFRFGVDVQYANQDGVMKKSFRDKVNTSLYVQYNYKTLSVKNHVIYNTTKSQESPYGDFAQYSRQLPYNKYEDETGKPLRSLQYWGTGTPSFNINPLYEPSLYNYNRSSYAELINNLSINWKILPELLLKGQLSLSKSDLNKEEFYDPLSLNSRNIEHLASGNMSSGTAYRDNTDDYMVDFSINLSYNKTINDHNINAIVGFNAQEKSSVSDGIIHKGFPSGALSSPMYAKEVHNKGSYAESKNRLMGVVASLNYTFKDTYLLDASVRVDGSSAFGTNKRFAPFWSLGVGLALHKYDFIKDLGFVDQFKIRGSYGQTGKANFPAYAARTTFQIRTEQWYKTGYGATLVGLGNENLKWETTNTLDVGGEFSLFNGKLFVKGTYYNKLTVDLINDITIPTSTGFTIYRDNVGEISNKGYEFEVRVAAIQKKDFNLYVNANLGHNKNTIEKISNSMKAYNQRVRDQYAQQIFTSRFDSEKLATPFIQYEEGGSMNSIWGVQSLGINPADGQEVFYSRTGRLVRSWDASDQVVMGNSDPKITGNIGFNLTYKQFSLYTSFMYSAGGQRYNHTLVNKVENVNVYADNVDRRVLEERWKNPGDVAKYKSLISGRKESDRTKPTTRFIQDYDVLSWNSVEFSYDFSPAVTSKLHMGLLRLSIGMNDLINFSSVKMERGLSYPFARSVNFSLRASF